MSSPHCPYPPRQAYFAHRYCRLLTKTCAAQEIGHIAFTLCVTIAHLEDAKRYSGPVTFYNEQLMALVGVSKWRSLNRARDRATLEGWLYYEPGNRGQRMAGRYWVTIPERFGDLDDSPCDEANMPQGVNVGANGSTPNVPQRAIEGVNVGAIEGVNISTLSLSLCNRASDDASVSPKKDTNGKRMAKRFTKPTVEEVRAYCLERKNHVDPQQFIDHYDSKGWMVGKNPMKDWRAAIRSTWERTHFGGNDQPKKPEPLKYRA